MSNQNFWKNTVDKGAVLSPVDRTAEVLFGLIMVLTFTGAISVSSDGREDIRQLLWAALGCNVAWGIVDAAMYLMNVLLERGHGMKTILKIQNTKDPFSSRESLKAELQPLVASLLKDDEVDMLSDRIKKLPEPLKKHLMTINDLTACLQIFLLVFLCTLPVALPFAFFSEVAVGMRVSNAIALLMLFGGGYYMATYAGFRPLITALAYTLLGVLLVAITMALEG